MAKILAKKNKRTHTLAGKCEGSFEGTYFFGAPFGS